MTLTITRTLGELFSHIQYSSISFIELFVALLTSAVVGLFIFIIYKFSFSQTAYSYTFNVALILLTMITTVIILTLGSSSVVLSLGMVGTLSVVRFRSTLKDPIDIIYILWATAAGLAIGANQYLISILGSATIGAVILILTFFKLSIKSFLVHVNYPKTIDTVVMGAIKNQKVKLRSKIIKNGSVELTLEVTKDHERVMKALGDVEHIDNLSLISFED